MHPHLTLITLGVGDFDRSLAFYHDLLGWPTDAKPGDPVAFFPLSTILLGLFPREELAKDAGVSNDGSGFPGFSLAHNLGSRADVDALFALLRKKGVAIVKLPQETSWGGYSGYFSDPDGYLWEVAHNPFWTLDAQGRAALQGNV